MVCIAWLIGLVLVSCSSGPEVADEGEPDDNAGTARLSDDGSSAERAADSALPSTEDLPDYSSSFFASIDGLLPANTPLSLIAAATGGLQTEKASMIEIDARIGDCMRSQGADYSPLVSQYLYVVQDFSTIGQRLNHAHRYGYGIYYGATDAGAQADRQQTELFLDEDVVDVDKDEQYWMALMGTPDGSPEEIYISATQRLDELGDGCLREAVVSFREDQSLPELTDGLYSSLSQVFTVYQTSVDFQSAIDDWIKCMADAGVDAEDMSTPYVNFDTAFLDGVGLNSPEEAQRQFEEERQVAIADVECQWQHTLAARLRLEHDHLQGLVEANPELAPFLVVVEELFE